MVMKKIRAMTTQRKRVGVTAVSGYEAAAMVTAIRLIPQKHRAGAQQLRLDADAFALDEQMLLDVGHQAVQPIAGLLQGVMGAAWEQPAAGLEAQALAVDPLHHAALQKLVEDEIGRA